MQQMITYIYLIKHVRNALENINTNRPDYHIVKILHNSIEKTSGLKQNNLRKTNIADKTTATS